MPTPPPIQCQEELGKELRIAGAFMPPPEEQALVRRGEGDQQVRVAQDGKPLAVVQVHIGTPNLLLCQRLARVPDVIRASQGTPTHPHTRGIGTSALAFPSGAKPASKARTRLKAENAKRASSLNATLSTSAAL